MMPVVNRKGPDGLAITLQHAKNILREVSGERSSLIMDLIQDSKWSQIVGQNMPDPCLYTDADTFARDYQSYNLLRKFDSFPVDIDRAAAAFESFAKSEESCRNINEKHCCFAYQSGVPLDLQVTSVLYRARDLIKDTLGSFKIDEFLRKCAFSNGASTRLRRKAGDPWYKFKGRPHVTANCLPLAACFAWHHESWKKVIHSRHDTLQDPTTWFTVVEGSRFTTVPKDSKTDRGINIEPEMNMFFQKSIGAMIRHRLKRRGIDLNDQTANQRLARLAYFFGYATLDLSRASDSVSLSLVDFLLPPQWVDYLMMCRSPRVKLPDGTLHRLEKIASMGNGYTFELESLIFWAISASVSKVVAGHRAVSIYGDDIIVDRNVAPELVRVLESVGFAVNVDKSFIEGNFFESCGKHYFKGADVSPFYLKEKVETAPDVYRLHNRCREWWTPLHKSARKLRKIEKVPNVWVPPSFPDDSGFRGEWDEARPKWSRRRRAWVVKYLRTSSKEHDISSCQYGYLKALHSLSATSEQVPELEWRRDLQSRSLRQYVTQGGALRIGRAFVHSWF